MNSSILIGRLVRDPILKFTTGKGVPVCTFTLAVTRDYVNGDGQKESDFVPIVCWNELAKIVADNIVKGRKICVRGSIQTRKYQATDGTDRYATEVVADKIEFLDYAKDVKLDSTQGEFTYNGDEEIYKDTPLDPNNTK